MTKWMTCHAILFDLYNFFFLRFSSSIKQLLANDDFVILLCRIFFFILMVSHSIALALSIAPEIFFDCHML